MSLLKEASMEKHKTRRDPIKPNLIAQKGTDSFRIFAHKTSEVVGSPWAFVVSAAIVLIWACIGPLFNFSDTWQLVINTATTIITFLMVFVIQNTQNRDARAIHLKLDELLNAVEGARLSLIDLEHMSDEELSRVQKEFEKLRNRVTSVDQTKV
jgi:low affinity Fe/Cu permease